MNVTATMALVVAERVERTGGPRAGLVAWRAVATNTTDAELRGRALLAALRCALALRDEAALRELIGAWPTVDRGVWDESIAALCRQMIGARHLTLAAELAAAEARRHRTAYALYLHARCLELSHSAATASDAAIAGAFRDAAVRAANEGAREIELAARVRRIVMLSRSWSTLREALADAGRLDLTKLPPRARLEVAAVLLASPSRFARAGAIDAIDGVIVAATDEALARHALTIVASWVDDAADALSPLELDRLRALVSRERAAKLAPRAKEVLRVLERLQASADESAVYGTLDEGARIEPSVGSALARASDILRGRFEAGESASVGHGVPAEPLVSRTRRQRAMLDAVAALRDGAFARAARVFDELASAASPSERLPSQILGVAHSALAHDDADLRAAAIRLIAHHLRRPGAGSPAGGFLPLADTLAALGQVDLSLTARRAAALNREAGAQESLGNALARAGWELAEAGERAAAMDKLREAKAIFGD